MKILVPLNPRFGASYYRMAVPAAYLPGHLHVDFYRYRLNQYETRPLQTGLNWLDRTMGTAYDYAKWAEAALLLMKQRRYDALWLSRSLLNYPNRLERKLDQFVYDFDDAVWLGEAGQRFSDYCQRARVVFAGNSFLAERASRFNSHVKIVPTSVDTTVHRKQPAAKKGFHVGWIGSSSGFRYLHDIADALLAFFSHQPTARLHIVADRFPSELKSLHPFLVFTPWNIHTSVALINTFSVGIMPLTDSDWERGKCSFKMLQYMACEVPVVASAVGMNNELFALAKETIGTAVTSPRGWTDALLHYASVSEAEREAVGANGRALVEKHFAAARVSKAIASHLSAYF